MSEETSQKVVFISKEHDKIEISMEAARLVELAKDMLEVHEDHEDEEPQTDPIEIPITNVSTAILKSIVEFCEHQIAEPMVKIDQPLKSHCMSDVVQDYYAEFVNVEQGTLRDLILAANFMNINPLLDLTCAKVATFTAGLTPSEIRATFDMTSEDVIASATADNDNAAVEQPAVQPAVAEAENPVAEAENPAAEAENPAAEPQ